MEESFSHKLSSRITNIKKEAQLHQAHPFNYQLYKKSVPNAEGESDNDLVRKNRLDLKKKNRQKDFTAMSFDHRVCVAKHMRTEDIEQ